MKKLHRVCTDMLVILESVIVLWSSIQCGPTKEPLLIELSAVLVAQMLLKLNVHAEMKTF